MTDPILRLNETFASPNPAAHRIRWQEVLEAYLFRALNSGEAYSGKPEKELLS